VIALRGFSQQGRIAYSEGDFLTLSGENFFYRCWRVPGPSELVILVHDLGEDSGHYREVGERIASEGISVYIMDLRGHGKSCGERGHVDNFQRMVRDLSLFVNLAASKEKSQPYILAQGFGALLALGYAATGRVRGLVLYSPLVTLKDAEDYVTGVKAALMDLFASKKRVQLNLGSRVTVTVRLLRELARVQGSLHDYAKRVEAPTLIIYDPNSEVVDSDAVLRLFESLGSREKYIREVSGGYSLLKSSDEALEEALAWIKDREG